MIHEFRVWKAGKAVQERNAGVEPDVGRKVEHQENIL